MIILDIQENLIDNAVIPDQMNAIEIDKDSNQEEELRARFTLFDKDGNGLITRDELRDVMTQLGEKMSEDDIDEMIEDADKNGDGMINYEEFVAYMMQ